MTETTPRYAARERSILTPTQLNRLARGLLEDAFALVWVEGEISNYTRAASGHWYFTLKDRDAQIRSAMFRSNNLYVRAKPVDGMQVLVRGRVSLFEARGDYQLICEHLEEAGQGRLMREFEALKARLHAEGLTAAARKRALPAWPRRLAVVTSPQGAAIRDVLAVIARRWPLLAVDLYPTAVQGVEAPSQLRAALQAAMQAQPRADAILLTRGGGSLEDLWAFNDETLARLIAASPVPVVSAVGHEVDVSIADLVADMRAPTPSAAAELLTPDQSTVLTRLRARGDTLLQRLRQRMRQAAQQLDAVERLLRAHEPRAQVSSAQRLLQGLQQRNLHLWQQRQQRARLCLHEIGERLRAQAPRLRVARTRQHAEALRAGLLQQTQHSLRAHGEALLALRSQLLPMRPDTERRRDRLHHAVRAIAQLGPSATLARGYALLRRADGSLLTRVTEAKPGETLEIELADGRLRVRIEP